MKKKTASRNADSQPAAGYKKNKDRRNKTSPVNWPPIAIKRILCKNFKIEVYLVKFERSGQGWVGGRWSTVHYGDDECRYHTGTYKEVSIEADAPSMEVDVTPSSKVTNTMSVSEKKRLIVTRTDASTIKKKTTDLSIKQRSFCGSKKINRSFTIFKINMGLPARWRIVSRVSCSLDPH